MNVPFVVRGAKANGADGRSAAERDTLEDRATEAFVRGAFKRNLVGMRTNTPFGFGRFLRASLYNAVSVDDAKVLAQFMREFQDQYRAA